MSFTYRILLGTSVLATLAVGCKDDETLPSTESVAVDIAFEGTVGADALALESQTYQASGVAEGFHVSRLSFYLSDIALVSSVDGGELLTDVAEVAYVELSADGTARITLDQVPQGTYTGIRFNLGLTEDQDALQPKDFAPGTPLARASEYWVDWGSYIFLKVEGRADNTADGRARFDKSFVYHVGKAAENTRTLTVRTPVVVTAEGATMPIRVDVAELLGLNSSDPLSLLGAADHNNTAATRIMDNATRAFTRAQ